MKEKLVRFTVRLNEEENTKLTLLSEKYGKSKNEVIRNWIKNDYDEMDEQLEIQKEMIKCCTDLSFQLRKFGVVLNQTNKMFFNSTNKDVKRIEEELTKLWESIRVLKE